MSQLTIVAHITAKPDKVEFVKAQLQGLIETTRAEPGCVQYDLHQDNDNPAHFLFFENWDTREQWQNHMHAPHLLAYKAATEGAVDAFALHEMTRIG